MGALQVLVFVASALVILENGCWRAEGASYAFTTRLQPSSANRAATRTASTQHRAVVAPGTTRRANLGIADYRRYLPVEDTPEVKEAKERFFKLYKKQATLAAEAPDNDLDGQAYRANHDDYYYDYEEESNEYEDDEEEGSEEEDEEDDDDDDDDDDDEDSDEEDEDSDDEDSSSSSSSEEDGEDSSSEEDGEDSSEEDGEDSSEEDGEDSSSSSSSSSSEEDGDTGAFWASRGRGVQPLNTNALRPVTDTPEVKQAKRNFFNLYKAQAELSFNAPDDK